MNGRILFTVATAAALACSIAGAQQRRANVVRGGGDAGRCYAEVIVDGAAEIQINGDHANLQNLSGAQPQWRRFECTGPMPANADVRLNVNGRGRAQLVATPRNGGPAVVRIEDSDGGADLYRLEFQWAGAFAGDQRQNPGFGNNRGGFGAEQAIQVCRDAIRQEAVNRFGTRDVNFRRINIDDNPGRRDWVIGTIDVRRGARGEQYPFSCSVNLENGNVRQARIESPNEGRVGSAGRDMTARQMDTCRSAVLDRLGGERVEFGPMNIDDRYGDDLVRGSARSRNGQFDFTCSVNPYNGNVRNVDLRRR